MTAQAARKTPARNAGVIDLDAMLFQRSTKPATVRLSGRDFELRRDLSAEEVVQCWVLFGEGKDDAAWKVLLGEEDGPALNKMIQSLPQQMYQHVLRKLLATAGLKMDPPEDSAESEEDGDEGKS